MKKIDWGWQGKARKLRMRGEYLLKNMSIPADITFRVGADDGKEETIPAHKLILGIGSEVFYAMLFGPNAKAHNTEVVIPNYRADVFKVVVTFLYSDRAPDLTMDNAMEVLKCAEQYGIPELATKCRAFVLNAFQQSDCAEHAVLTISKARELDEMEVVRHVVNVLKSKDLVKMSHSDLDSFLMRSDLILEAKDEIALYQAAYRWAEHRQAEEESQGLPRRTLRDILGTCLRRIRFPLIGAREMLEGPLKHKIFSPEEVMALYRVQLGDVTTVVHFLTTVRKAPQATLACHF